MNLLEKILKDKKVEVTEVTKVTEKTELRQNIENKRKTACPVCDLSVTIAPSIGVESGQPDQLRDGMEFDCGPCRTPPPNTMNCLGAYCTDACYHPDNIEPHNDVLWCKKADSAVIDLVSCPNGHWRKDKYNRPYPGFCHEDCTLFVCMPVPFLKDATKDYQYPVPHCCHTKTCVSALSACPLGKPEIVEEKRE